MIDEIVQAVHSIPNRVMGSGNRAWTQAVKSAFIGLGEKLEWKVCASSTEAEVEPEWLFDLCWYKRSENEGLDIGLVLESEWSHHKHDLIFDFEKLLCAKSPYKIFIFESYENVLLEKLEYLETAIKNCQLPSNGECYTLAAYDLNRKEFKIKNVNLP